MAAKQERQIREIRSLKQGGLEPMNTATRACGPVRTAMVGFLALTGTMAGLAIAKDSHVLDGGIAERAIGLVMGVTIIFTGNLVPKLRPLNASTENRALAARAERFAGWILVLMGIVYTLFFVFAPLAEAKWLSSIIGLGAIAVIAVDWIWPRRRTPATSIETDDGTTTLTRRRTLAIWLLFAMFYAFAAVCIAFLFGHRGWGNGPASWLVVGFSLACAVLQIVLSAKRSPS
jgi:hypothetical protein